MSTTMTHPPFPGTEGPEAMTIVASAAHWIRSAAVPTSAGLVWRDEPDLTGDAGKRHLHSLANGGAGIVTFLLELAMAEGPDHWASEHAADGARHLAVHWRDYLADYPETSKMPNRNLSLAYGVSGIAFALATAGRILDDAALREAAREATQHVADAARSEGEGLTWTGEPALAGDGGIVCHLLWAAAELGESTWIDTAAGAGERMLALAEDDPRGGKRWLGLAPHIVGYPEGTYIPNFTAGTAGIAYVLARLAEATGDDRFREAGASGADHIRAIAAVDRDAALVMHHEPGGEHIYYVGQCMGPAGTARLFYELYRQHGEEDDLAWVEKLGRGVVRTGAPELQSPGYWNTVSQCCGTAGLLDFFTSLWVATGNESYRELSDVAADVLVRRASNPDGAGHRWYYAPQAGKPDFIVGRTNYLKGAAGPAASLLRRELDQRGLFSAIRFPDNPFPDRQPDHRPPESDQRGT